MPPYISIGGYSDPPRISYFSLEVSAGELVALTGAPGSGKSNLMKSIAGIRSASRGSIRIIGARPGSIRARERAVFVFQSGNFSPDLSMRIQLERKTALLRGVPVRMVKKDVRNWCEDMELAEAAESTPGQLNRSQVQMFAFAPLALSNPLVAVLDEPLANLSSLRTSTALSIVFSLLKKDSSVLVLAQKKSPLATKADRTMSLL